MLFSRALLVTFGGALLLTACKEKARVDAGVNDDAGVVSSPALPPPILNYGLGGTIFILAGTATGSGALIGRRGSEGLIITNAHVVTMEAGVVRDGVEVVFRSGTAPKREVGRVVAADAKLDLAIIVARTPASLQPLALSNEPLVSGARVYAFGFPFGEELAISATPDPNVSSGSVLGAGATHGGEASWLAVRFGIHPGSSGGPVTDDRGRVVGIAVAKMMGTMTGFIVPASDAIKFTEHNGYALSVWCAECAPPVVDAQAVASTATAAPRDAFAIIDDGTSTWGLFLRSWKDGALVVAAAPVNEGARVRKPGTASALARISPGLLGRSSPPAVTPRRSRSAHGQDASVQRVSPVVPS